MSNVSFLTSSIQSIEALPNVTPQVLEMIKKLEENSQKLSQYLQKLTKTKKSNVEHAEEIQVIRRTISTIFHKKNALVMSCYDLIDQKVKYIDQMSQSVDELIQLSSSSNRNITEESGISYLGMKRARSSSDLQSRKEPLYCICNQVAYGDMIACDNEQCSIEWFHYACVGLVDEPSEWLCRQCQAMVKEKKSHRSSDFTLDEV